MSSISEDEILTHMFSKNLIWNDSGLLSPFYPSTLLPFHPSILPSFHPSFWLNEAVIKILVEDVFCALFGLDPWKVCGFAALTEFLLLSSKVMLNLTRSCLAELYRLSLITNDFFNAFYAFYTSV